MTLTQLEYIVAVDTFRSFVKAAEACHVAQPSLSAQVLKLEEEIGVKIFERGRSGIDVTAVGKEVLEQARVTLNEAKKIQDICLVHKNEVRGTLRLGIIPTISPYLLPHFIEKVTQMYPDLKLEIQEDKTEKLVADLEKGLLDVALLSTPKKAPASIMEKVLYYEPFVFFGGVGHPLLKKRKIGVEELKTYPPTLLDDTHCMRDQVESICASTAIAHSITLRNGTLPTLIQLVNGQKGFTLIPYLALETLSESQRKNQVLLFEEPVPSRKVSLIFHKTYMKRPLIEALIKTIASNLPRGILTTPDRSKMKVLDPEKRHFDQ